MDLNYIIIDNFLDKPDIVRESVISGQIPFNEKGKYPGVRCNPSYIQDDYREMVRDKISQVLPYKFKFRDDSHCFAFQLCLEGSETWIHVDVSDWAGILYLNPDARVDSGTAMFDGGYDGKAEKPECINIVGNVYNRMVLFRGKNIPHASMVPGFGDSLDTGRLTQVLFFDLEE